MPSAEGGEFSDQGNKVTGQEYRLSCCTSLSPFLHPCTEADPLYPDGHCRDPMIRRVSHPQYLIPKQEDLHSGPEPVGVELVGKSKKSFRGLPALQWRRGNFPSVDQWRGKDDDLTILFLHLFIGPTLLSCCHFSGILLTLSGE